jgi:signal transduction histidine kinase
VTAGQAESLALIERRGRELLALIETILDAARVEAGQLTLVLDDLDAMAVIEQAVAKGRDLGGDRELQVVVEMAPGMPRLKVDRVRLSRALATVVACAIREAVGPSVRIVVGLEQDRRVRVEVEVPGERLRTSEIRTLFDPPDAPGAIEHRGLALALRLGRTIIELHGGDVTLVDHPGAGSFRLHLPAET